MDNTLAPDAQRLLSQAQAQLNAMSPEHSGYAALLSAINNLNGVLYSNPSQQQLAAAMGVLTQAMAAGQ